MELLKWLRKNDTHEKCQVSKWLTFLPAALVLDMAAFLNRSAAFYRSGSIIIHLAAFEAAAAFFKKGAAFL